MKKALLAGFLALAVGGAAFALPEFRLSAGAGGYFAANWTTFTFNSVDSKTNYMGGGIFAFFDATYAELDLGVQFGGFSGDYLDVSTTHFAFGILGKFPIGLTEKLSVFPAAGIDYGFFLGGKSNDVEIARGDLPGDGNSYDQLVINVGAGLDFGITGNLFLRGTVLWGFRLLNSDETDGLPDDVTSFSHGPKIKLAVGYSF